MTFERSAIVLKRAVPVSDAIVSCSGFCRQEGASCFLFRTVMCSGSVGAACLQRSVVIVCVCVVLRPIVS